MGITIAAAIYQKSPADDPNKNAGHAVVGLFFIYYAFYNIAMSPLLVSYTVEILPFALRSKGLFLMQECVNISLVFNQYVNPVALPKLQWKYYVVYTVWIAVEFVWLWFTIIETKGKNGPLPLEEIAMLFDGQEARERVFQGVNMQAATASNQEDNREDVNEKAFLDNQSDTPVTKTLV